MKTISALVMNSLHWVFNFGVTPGMSTEEERAINNANLFYLLALLLGLIILIETLRLNTYAFIPVAGAIILGALAAFIVVARTGRPFIPSMLLLGGLTVFFLTLTATGGSTSTSFVWVFVFPFLYFFTFSFRVGLGLFLFLLLGLYCIFFIPGDPLLSTEYSLIMRQRIFIASIFAGCAALASEFIRWQNQQKIQALLAELRKASQTDQLTGLYNRRAFLERYSYEISRSMRDTHPMCVIMLDIDHFKRVNDSYGHHCGDMALKHLAGLIQPVLRLQDTLARWGGEEFILLLPETDTDGGMILAEKIRAGLEASQCVCGQIRFSFTISLGVHQCDLAESSDISISKADAKLYRAKHMGRNRVCASMDE